MYDLARRFLSTKPALWVLLKDRRLCAPRANLIQTHAVGPLVGPADGLGDETFDVTVCTPEWLAQACRTRGGIYDARHHVVVTMEQFDERAMHDWFEARVRRVEGDDWNEIGNRLARLGFSEFEDYTPWGAAR